MHAASARQAPLFSFLLLLLSVHALLVTAACSRPRQAPVVPDRPSFAPDAPRVENARLGRFQKKFDGGEFSAAWIRSGIPAEEEAAERHVREAAAAFERRAAALAQEMPESGPVQEDGGKAAGPEAGAARWRLSMKGGLSESNGVVGRLWVSEEYLGGDHGNMLVGTESYDRKSGRQLAAGDLFANPENLPLLFSRAARERLARKGFPGDLYMPATEPDPGNFSRFLVTDSGVALYFEPYRVAPWAEGMVVVPVSLGELAGAHPLPGRWAVPQPAAGPGQERPESGAAESSPAAGGTHPSLLQRRP